MSPAAGRGRVFLRAGAMPVLDGFHPPPGDVRMRDMRLLHREQVFSPAARFGVPAIEVFDETQANCGQILGKPGGIEPGEPRLPRRRKRPLEPPNAGQRAITTQLALLDIRKHELAARSGAGSDSSQRREIRLACEVLCDPKP